jgi:nucleoside 2-deoxyribosyltransferase
MQEWAKRLEYFGHVITSRWIKGDHEIISDANGDADRQRFAEEDINGILSADVLIFHSHPDFFRSGRGGRHVELGVALALNKKIILIGERENVFHWLSCVEVYSDFASAMFDIRRWEVKP